VAGPVNLQGAAMVERSAERGVKNMERRLTAVEHILPTLVTKTDLETAVGELRTEIQAAIAPLATKAEVTGVTTEVAAVRTDVSALKSDVSTLKTDVSILKTDVATLKTEVTALKVELYAAIRAEGVETRRHFDVVADGMHADFRILAEGLVTTQGHCDTRHRDVTRTLNEHDHRLTRLEALPSKGR
jgi:chaperonin cofactor prefoldin